MCTGSNFSVAVKTLILVNLSRLVDCECQVWGFLLFGLGWLFLGGWLFFCLGFWGGCLFVFKMGDRGHRENFDSPKPMPFTCFHNCVPAWVDSHCHGTYSSKLFSEV